MAQNYSNLQLYLQLHNTAESQIQLLLQVHEKEQLITPDYYCN